MNKHEKRVIGRDIAACHVSWQDFHKFLGQRTAPLTKRKVHSLHIYMKFHYDKMTQNVMTVEPNTKEECIFPLPYASVHTTHKSLRRKTEQKTFK